MMIIYTAIWYGMLLLFVHFPGILGGRISLMLAGFAQSLSMVPMAVMLLHGAGPKFRGRVKGVRMLAIYGLPLGLLAAGLLIDTWVRRDRLRLLRLRSGDARGDRTPLARRPVAAECRCERKIS